MSEFYSEAEAREIIRQSVVDEKLIEEAASESTDDPGGRLFRSRTYKALAERDFTGHMDEGRRTAFYEGWSAREQWESTRPGQGEPSDAQVEAATRAWSLQYHAYASPHQAMRAALRAAGEVR